MKLPIFVSISALAAIATSAQSIERVVDPAIEPGASSTLGISLSTGGSDEKTSLYRARPRNRDFSAGTGSRDPA